MELNQPISPRQTFRSKDSKYSLLALVSILAMLKVKDFIQDFDNNNKRLLNLCILKLIYISVLEIQDWLLQL